jgi:murein DD-endopeptidase MepM/ murein hydrolase activator NlpD
MVFMRCWPVPGSKSREVPASGSPGSFWEDRGDRHHTGIDIYASVGSRVVSVESGRVFKVGVFSRDEMNPYWNTTYFVLVRNDSGLVCKYAELGDFSVKVGDMVRAGDVIGYVGQVLNPGSITIDSPSYIQSLKERGNLSMLHFEVFRPGKTELENYMGGNVFSGERPKNLMDPSEYLKGL